jgi:hypothetical protein
MIYIRSGVFILCHCQPIVPDYMSMADKWNNNIENGSTRRKTCPSITDPIHITQTGQGFNQGLRAEKAETNRFGYDAPSPPSSAHVMNR